MKPAITAFILICMLPGVSYSGQLGTMAPDFSAADMNNKTVTLSQLRGKVVFLNFWAPWCGSCREELPELDALHGKYASAGLEVVGISVGTSASGAAGFLKRNALSFTVLPDENGTIGDSYRVSGLPAGFLIGRDGIIRYTHRGFGRNFLPVFEKEILELLNQR